MYDPFAAGPYTVEARTLQAHDADASLPLDGMYELFERTPGSKRMVILRRADHLHFIDDVEAQHEAVRTMPLTGDIAGELARRNVDAIVPVTG